MTTTYGSCAMPTGADPQLLLLDTSAAVALCVADHSAHEATADALAGAELGLAGHAAFETFSVLTRLPAPVRLTPAVTARLLARAFPHSRFLTADAARRLLDSLPDLRLAGGAVYDALVAGVAAEHGLPLVSRDGRAVDTYSRLDVDVRLLA